MAINWVFDYRPTSIDDMALYPLLRKRLEFYIKTGDFSHLLFAGDTGVGKTTAARILCGMGGDTVEYNCAQENTRTDMLKLAKGTTSVSLWGSSRNIIMDEFHHIPLPAQTVFNKGMEDAGRSNTFVFCVNDIHAVAPPIVSRCMTLRFDVGILNPKSGKIAMHSYAGITKDEWIVELKRVGKIVAEKAGYTPTEEQLDIIASNDLYIIDPRRYIRNLEEQIKMDEMAN